MQILFRYLVAGGTAAVLHLVVLILFVELTNVNATVASAIGFFLAVCLNYTLQYHWTFGLSEPHCRILTKYIVITTAMLGVNTVIFWVLFVKINVSYVIAQIIATGIVTVLNFTINKHFTFTSPSADISHE